MFSGYANLFFQLALLIVISAFYAIGLPILPVGFVWTLAIASFIVAIVGVIVDWIAND